MIITTSERVEGKTVARTIGLVRGNTIQARHIGKDLRAGFKGIVGGEITDYTEMMSSAREEAIQRM
ncbi:MAG: heavy metal-binding domain-containing protein, partial [Dehalococcoidales bacterium]|nr:heavy metal-binding domain-containing protein [Dehalococcoidales bacterium]